MWNMQRHNPYGRMHGQDRTLELGGLLAEESQKWGLKIDTKKTKIMPVTKKNGHTNRFSAEEMNKRLYITSYILEVTLIPMDLV